MYEKNCLFISSCRKQLIENMRSLRNLAGFDYLGGIDTHWHLIGYPCGVFNEFYEEKYGESIADVRRYCGESVLLCTAGNLRNRQAGTLFSEDIEFSCFESETLFGAELEWSFETADHQMVASGKNAAPEFLPGKVATAGHVEFSLPAWEKGVAAVLKVTLRSGEKVWDNYWNFWVFPAGEFAAPEHVRIVDRLDIETIEFLKDGGAVLLTGNFPGTANPENFRSHTSGRSLGHAGALFNPHPLWEKFPHAGFLDWQFSP